MLGDSSRLQTSTDFTVAAIVDGEIVHVAGELAKLVVNNLKVLERKEAVGSNFFQVRSSFNLSTAGKSAPRLSL